MQIGEKIEFYKYEWRVLDIKKNAALIITEYIIEKREYHTKKEATWADCELRKYLNGEFYERFAADEKMRIIPVTNTTPDNPWYGTSGGADTEDKIFLLNIEDAVCRYFGDSSKHLAHRTKSEKYWFAKKDENNIKRVTNYPVEGAWGTWWWLRTPGRDNRLAVYIHGNGCVGINGNGITKRAKSVTGTGGVRPALWLKL